jgi:hypothetical protein
MLIQIRFLVRSSGGGLSNFAHRNIVRFRLASAGLGPTCKQQKVLAKRRTSDYPLIAAVLAGRRRRWVRRSETRFNQDVSLTLAG